MTIQLNEEYGGKVLAVHVSGKLAKSDYEQFVPEFERLVRQHGMAIFCKPFTRASVRYFDHSDVAEAGKWFGYVEAVKNVRENAYPAAHPISNSTQTGQ